MLRKLLHLGNCKVFVFLSLMLFIFLTSNLTAQHIWFSDNFNSAKLNNVWVELSGVWKIENGRLKLKATNNTSQLGLNFLIPPNSRYNIKFSFAGDNCLVLFNVYDIFSFKAGNYVKFSGNALYTGVVEVSGDEKIEKFVSLPSSRNKMKEILIEVSPEKYTVYFNDKKVVEGKTYFKSGYVILGARKGEVEFDYLIISSNEKYRTIEDLKKLKEPLIDHITSIAIIDNSTFAISSDVYSQVQVLDNSGNVVNRFTYLRWAGGVMYFNDRLFICDAGKITIVLPDRTANVAQFMVKYPNYIHTDGEKFYIIDDGAVKIFDRNFKLIYSFTDPANLKFPTSIAVDKYNIYCTDPELGYIAVYPKRDTIKLLRRIKGELIAPVDVKYDSLSNSFFVADVGLKAVIKISNDKVEKIFKGEGIGGLKFPRSIDLKSGMIFIADADKIVAVDTTLSEERAKLILKR